MALGVALLGCSSDDPEDAELEASSGVDEQSNELSELPAPSDVDFETLGPGLSGFDGLSPFIAIDLSSHNCAAASGLLAAHFVENHDLAYQTDIPIDSLAGYYTVGDQHHVARVETDDQVGVLFLLTAYATTLRYEDLIRGNGETGTWCSSAEIESAFRDAVRDAGVPEFLDLPERGLGIEVTDAAELVAVLATDGV